MLFLKLPKFADIAGGRGGQHYTLFYLVSLFHAPPLFLLLLPPPLLSLTLYSPPSLSMRKSHIWNTLTGLISRYLHLMIFGYGVSHLWFDAFVPLAKKMKKKKWWGRESKSIRKKWVCYYYPKLLNSSLWLLHTLRALHHLHHHLLLSLVRTPLLLSLCATMLFSHFST